MSHKQLKDQLMHEKAAFYASFDLQEAGSSNEQGTIDSYAALQVSLGSELLEQDLIEQNSDGVRYTIKHTN